MRVLLSIPFFLALTSTLAAAQTSTSFELLNDTTPTGGATVATGDFNEDGKPDYVNSAQEMSVRLGNGDGTFRPPVVFGTPGQSIQDISVADINRDGHLDVVTTSYQGISIYFGKGDGTFQTGTPITFSNVFPMSAAVADFNGDGLLDIAVGLTNGAVEIYNNVGGRNFVLAKVINPVSPPNEILTVRAGDVDGNGTVDLAVGTNLAAYVLWGDGKGGFTPVLLTSYPNGSGAYAFVGDLNQDSRPDIMVYHNCSIPQPAGHASSTCTNIDVFYGNQGFQKTFYRTAATSLPIGVYASDLRAVDINGDGIGDIAVSARDQYGSQEGMFFYLGNPDGSFRQTPERYIATSDGVGNFALADFNRDGMMDVVQVLDSAGATEVYLNATNRPPCATSIINPTVTVCSPVDRTYSLAPVNVHATAYDKTTITDLQEYLDGKLFYSGGQVTSLNVTVPASVGTHLFVTKAFDASGVTFRSNRTITVYSGTPGAVCSVAPSSANICLPPGATSHSPVHILANADTRYVPTSSQLYVDGSLVINNQGPTTAIDTYQALSAGTHQLVFKLFDASGIVSTASKSVTVN